MAKKQFLIIYLIQLSTLFSQFNSVNSSYEHSNLIKDEHKYILDNFNEKIENYFEYNNFSSEYDFLDISLNINIIFHKINFTSDNSFRSINCQILFSNSKDQHYITKNITLPYYKEKDLYFNTMQFDSIASLFDFYAYLFIANELDTWGLYLGEKYFNKAKEIANVGTESINSEQWIKNKKLIELLKENNYLRNAKFYFFASTDIVLAYLDENNITDIKNINENFYVSENFKESKNTLSLFIENLKQIYDKYSYEKYTIKFINYYNIEIAEYLKLLDITEGLEFLSKFDYKNEFLYIDQND
tara:strand:- start:1852 stop:2754 length:903 start_codon:yes stop_codon:yes gene_type:complete